MEHQARGVLGEVGAGSRKEIITQRRPDRVGVNAVRGGSAEKRRFNTEGTEKEHRGHGEEQTCLAQGELFVAEGFDGV